MMQTFTRHRTREEVFALCKSQDVPCRDGNSPYDDLIVVGINRSGFGYAFYNTVNGRFFGATPSGESFSSDQPRDGIDWFDALLAFFYVND